MLCQSSRRHALAASLSALALVTGCPGGLVIPDDAQLRCTDDLQCPADLICNVAAERCVPPGTILDLTAPLVASVVADVDRIGGAATSATVAIVASEAIADATIVAPAQIAVTTTVSGDTVVAAVSLAGVVEDGPIRLRLTWRDPAGNEAVVDVDTGVAVDLTPPALIGENIIIEANGNANVLSPAAPAALRLDSRVVARLAFDDRPSVSSVGLVFGRQTGADSTRFPTLDFETGDDDVVEVKIEAGALAGFDDGEWFFAVQHEDDLGNPGESLGTVPLVIDTTPPPPPTLDVVRRAPFGDGERATAETSLSGTAEDAVLIIAVPGAVEVGDDVAPPLVGRREPDDDGAFTLAVPLDIEAIRVVAVDAAGNLSAPASPATVELVASMLATTTPHRLFERPLSRDQLLQQADRPQNDALRAGAVTTTAAPTWTPLTTVVQDRIPDNPVMSWDPVNGATLMVAAGETMLLRGAQVRRLDVPRLPVRKGYGLATDERRGRVVLFGGDDVDGNARNSLFEWDGERWLEILAHDPAATDRPSPRVAHGVAFAPALGGVAIVNGCARDVELGTFGCEVALTPDVWVWDGATFSQRCVGAACEAGLLQPNRPEVAVDDEGRLIAHGGFSNFGSIGVPFPRPPAVMTFDGARWVGRCAEACAEALPPNPSMWFDPQTRAIQFLGICTVEGPCVVSLHDDDVFETTPLGNLEFPLFTGLAFQEKAVAVEPDGRLVIAQRGADGNDKGFVAAVVGARLGVVVPSTLQARCGGAIVERPGEHVVVGGCASCRLGGADGAAGSCIGPIGLAQAPGAPGFNRGETLAAGFVRAVDTGAGVRLLRAGLNPATGNGAVTVQDAAALDVPPTLVDLGPQRLVEGAFPLSGGRIGLRELLDDGSGILSPVEALRGLDGGANLVAVCDGACGLGGPSAFAFGVAGGADFGALFFGGDTNGGVSSQTVRLGFDGQPRSVTSAQTPPARRHADLAFDTARGAAWMFGGMSQPEVRFGSDDFDCGVPGGSPQCGDLWRFDDEGGWRPIQPVDIDGVGRPQPRYRAALGVFGGDVVVAGGRGPDFNNSGIDKTLDDAWRLSASPRQVPSHLVEVALTPYGADAEGIITGITVDWCGEARDAVVAVEARVWLGAGWRSVPLSPLQAGCASGVVDVATDADLVERNGRLFIEVRPVVQVDGPGDPTLTTTSLTVTTALTP